MEIFNKAIQSLSSNKIISIVPSMYNHEIYNGSEAKCGVTIDGVNYVLKRQKKDWNNVKSEYVASKVIKWLGGNVHDVRLAEENGSLVVLCKDFTQDGSMLRSIFELNESSIDTDVSKHEYFFEDIMYEISSMTKCDVTEFKEQFLQMYVFDTILGNPDRHAGNWGILSSQQGSIMAPIFDNGASLFPRANPEDLSVEWLEERIKVFPNSKIMFEGVRKRSSYYEMWHQNRVPSYAVEYARSLDIKKACVNIFADVNLSSIEKRFYASVIYNRYYCIIHGRDSICLLNES